MNSGKIDPWQRSGVEWALGGFIRNLRSFFSCFFLDLIFDAPESAKFEGGFLCAN